MFLSELKIGDTYALDDVKSQWGRQFKVEMIERIPAGFTEETWYGVVDIITDERLRINNPDDVKVLMVDESRPRNILLKLAIQVKPNPSQILHGIELSTPVGWIPDGGFIGDVPEEFLLAEGQALKKEEYPELWAAIGDSYTQTREIKEFPLNVIEKVKKFFGIKFTPRTYFVETRNCGKDEFRIPDLRGQFIR